MTGGKPLWWADIGSWRISWHRREIDHLDAYSRKWAQHHFGGHEYVVEDIGISGKTVLPLWFIFAVGSRALRCQNLLSRRRAKHQAASV